VTTYRYLVPLPPRDLSPNRRKHGAQKAPVVAAYRAEVVTAIARQEQGAGRPAAPLDRAVVTLTAGYSSRRPKREYDGAWPSGYMRWADRYRAADPDNLIAACKALIDALGCRSAAPGDAARLIVEDRYPHLTVQLGQPPIVGVPDWRDEGIFVEIAEVAA